jgi:hypothetical protein
VNDKSTNDPRADLDERIDDIESAYEFFLAYAAQGRSTDQGAGTDGSAVRQHIGRMEQALDGLGSVVRALARQRHSEGEIVSFEALLAAIESDSAKARAAASLVLAQPAISSQLIDNLNASIHVRALLTDLFVVDEALRDKKT